MSRFIGGLFRLRDILLAFLAALIIVLSTFALLLNRLLARVFPSSNPSSADAINDTRVDPSEASIIVGLGTRGGVSDVAFRSILDAVAASGGRHEVIVIGSPGIETKYRSQSSQVAIRNITINDAFCSDPWKEAANRAKHSIIVFLEGNVIVERDFLKPLIDSFKNPTLFAAAINPIHSGISANASSIRTRGEFRRGAIHLWKSPTTPKDHNEEPVLWVSRRATAFRRELFIELNEFSSIFSDTEYADADLCFRAWRRGWQVIMQPKSRVRFIDSALIPHRSPSSDNLARDRILFHWNNLRNPKRLIAYQSAMTFSLMIDALTGKLNLRPLRYALCALPQLLKLNSAYKARENISEDQILKISSHRLLLAWHKQIVDHKDQSLTTSRSSDRVAAESNASVLPRILLVLPQLPYPPVHGGAVRMWNELKSLSKRYAVDVLSFAEPHLSTEEVNSSVEQMKRYCGRVRVVTRKSTSLTPDLLDKTIHYEMFDCHEMREVLLDMVDDGCYDIIQFHKTEMGQYLLPKPAPIQILVEHIIFYHAYRRQFIDFKRPKLMQLFEYLKLRHYELSWCNKADAVLAMSDVDKELLSRRLPEKHRIFVAPNGVDTEYYQFIQSLPNNQNLLFIGNFDHSPNVDGIRFFLRKVYPSLKAVVPDSRLLIVGPGRYDTLEEVVSEPSVTPTGLVEDVRPYMKQCSVFIAPILAGSGTRIKILEAMAVGVPVVSTTIGAEGIGAVHGEHLLLADTPKLFAESIVQLIQDRDLRERLRSNARTLIETRYSWQVIGKRLDNIYRTLLQPYDIDSITN